MTTAYECDRCGACCKKLIIEISHLDVVREPSLLPVVEPIKNFDGSYEFESVWDRQYHLTIAEPCPKLAGDGSCSIYPTRPNCCVAFEAGSEQCQEVREEAGLGPLLPKVAESPAL